MKFITLIIYVFAVHLNAAFALDPEMDSLEITLKKHLTQDTNRVNILNEFAYELQGAGSPRSLPVALEALNLSRKLKYTKGEVIALRRLGGYYYQKAEYPAALKYFTLNQRLAKKIGDNTALGWAFNGKGTIYHSRSDYPKALENYLQAVKIFEKTGKHKEAASIMGNVGVLYKEIGDLELALKYYQSGLKIQEQRGDQDEIGRFLNNIGGIYSDQGKFDHAEAAFKRGLALAESKGNHRLTALILRNLLEMKVIQKDYPLSFKHGFRSLSLYQSLDDPEGIADVSYQIALAYLNSGKADSALYYAKSSLSTAQKIGFKRNIHNTFNVLAQAYAANHKFHAAYQAQRQYVAYKDSLTGEDQQSIVAGLKFQYELDKKQTEISMLNKERQLRMEEAKHQRHLTYTLSTGLLLAGLLAMVLIRNNKQKHTANLQLNQQKLNLQRTLAELKSTQAQLVQREKMASLGELTAGIAHEIQNPLNFVNNFSQVTEELLEELKEGPVQKLRGPDKAEVDELISYITSNLEKISHHGRRADEIVKAMLQHSRSSTGRKEETDLNALTDEFLRLSYHGIKGKDKSLNVTFHTDFDQNLKPINVNPQEMGRVLMNLFSNAFYSVAEKRKLKGSDYVPEVSVRTKRLYDGIEIKIRDNGMGIPANAVSKIYQPFFTTKPTGQGTGLGLSLSYDIITKGHGGEIKVETSEDGFAEFTIHLPVQDQVLSASTI